MDSLVKSVLDNKLHQQVSRRTFMNGAGGLAALTILGGATLAGCAPVTAPGGDGTLGGTLNFLGFDGEDGASVAKSFLASNGIKMQTSFQSALDEALTRFNTGGRGSMDILTPNKDFQNVVLKSGQELFQPLDLERIPNAAGLFSAFKDAPWLANAGETYGIPLIWGNTPCAYNPKKWDGVPDRYTDFSDKKFAGELAVLDDPFGIIWMFATSLGFPEPHRLTAKQLDQVVTALMAIKPNIVTFCASYGDMADVLVRGDVSMAIGGWAYLITIAKEKGVELAVAAPAIDGAGYWSDAYAIAVDAPNIDNAYAFINFMTSAESNAALAAELGSGCTVEAALALMPSEMQDSYPYDSVRESGGGILGTQTMMPPDVAEGDIVGAAEWADAWQRFKLG